MLSAKHGGDMADDVLRIYNDWVADNVHNVPGLAEAADFDAEIRRLHEKLERELSDLIPKLEQELGNIDDALTEAYENVHDPELGFKDARDA